ncbi:hypothetical protein EP7_000022 [Isosphaeraceae bacterium EP7]
MAKLSVNVALAELKGPDFKSSMKTLNAWELVRFDVGLGGTPVTLTVSQVAKCNSVDECTIDVPIGVSYSIASELKDNITNAQTTAERNDHRQLLMRIETHARAHYSRVAKPLIPDWEADIRKDLDKTLPTRKTPTSEDEGQIQARLAPLVAYWVEELGYRIKKDVNGWEKTDYPQLVKFMQNFRSLSVFLPDGLPIPKFASKPPKRPAITFPACQARKS